MGFLSVIKSVAAFTATSNPIVAAGLAAVNAVLPNDQQLSDDATGQQAIDAYVAMPLDKRALIDNRLAHDLGMEQESTKQIEALAIADAAGSSTRPEVARQMSTLLVFETLAFTVFLFWVLARDGAAGLAELGPLWIVFGTLTSVPATVIMTYFNARGKEKRTRYAVAHGQSANLSGMIGDAVRAFRK